MATDTVNAFRRARGKRLRASIAAVSNRLGRHIDILDVGGRADYWANVKPVGVRKIILLNLTPQEMYHENSDALFEPRVGDACDLSDYSDSSVDFVHSNSVIEHVGNWQNMQSMAAEMRRVACHGWVQTPAWGFPIEPHWKIPFIHWLGRPAQTKALKLRSRFRHTSINKRREIVESVSLLSRAELIQLFPETRIWTERFAMLPKSYTMFW